MIKKGKGHNFVNCFTFFDVTKIFMNFKMKKKSGILNTVILASFSVRNRCIVCFSFHRAQGWMAVAILGHVELIWFFFQL